MLKKLVLKDVQSHKKSVLNFSHGVNVIIGPSGAGKTAIVRALNWLVFNKAPSNITSHWSNSSSVYAIFDNHKVKRIRNKRTNIYKLDSHTFTSFGKSVPNDVVNAINMNEINFQYHTDPYFLLNYSPPEVARYLNKVINLSIIDNTIKNANSEKLKLQRSIDTKNEQVNKIKVELENYVWIDEAEAILQILETKQRTLDHEQITITSSETIIDDINDILRALKKVSKYSSLKYEVDKMVETDKILNEIRTDIDKIEYLIESILELQNDINVVNIAIKKDTKFLKDNFPDVCPLCEQEIRHEH